MSAEAIRNTLLAFADDEHLMGQQHTEWIGVAPTLEEDLAFSSIGQDELGHAVMLYELVLEMDSIEPTDAAVDDLAYGRDASDYRSCALTEYTTDDWAETLVRHWIYDAAEELRWGLAMGSSLTGLAEVAGRAEREEVYHRLHADALLDRLLADATARDRLLIALHTILPLVPSLLVPPPGEAEAVTAGVLTGSIADLAEPLRQRIAERFATTVDPLANQDALDGRLHRSDHFAPMMTRMREVIEYDPEAAW
jgi:ring-1,2-phenylacetyl-CoA epoxidase subunit PaaC